MSAHGDENTREAETGIIERSEENSIRFSPELVDERIKASLEPLHAQMSALTPKESTTESSQGFGNQYESPYSEGL